MDSPVLRALRQILASQEVLLLGLVRMELLSGIRDAVYLRQLQSELRAYDDLPLDVEDYETAAAFRTACHSKGVQGSLADFLLCAAAVRREMSVFTADADFKRFARLVPVELHLPDLIST